MLADCPALLALSRAQPSATAHSFHAIASAWHGLCRGTELTARALYGHILVPLYVGSCKALGFTWRGIKAAAGAVVRYALAPTWHGLCYVIGKTWRGVIYVSQAVYRDVLVPFAEASARRRKRLLAAVHKRVVKPAGKAIKAGAVAVTSGAKAVSLACKRAAGEVRNAAKATKSTVKNAAKAVRAFARKAAGKGDAKKSSRAAPSPEKGHAHGVD